MFVAGIMIIKCPVNPLKYLKLKAHERLGNEDTEGVKELHPFH